MRCTTLVDEQHGAAKAPTAGADAMVPQKLQHAQPNQIVHDERAPEFLRSARPRYSASAGSGVAGRPRQTASRARRDWRLLRPAGHRAQPAAGDRQRGGRSRGAQRFGRIGSTSRSATPATARARQRRRPGLDGGALRRIGSAAGGVRHLGQERERGWQLSAISSAGGRVSMAERLQQDVERR